MTKLGTWAEWTAAAARPLAQACTQARECVDLIGLTHWMACTEATRAMPRRRVRSMSPWRDRRHEHNARSEHAGVHGRTGSGTRMPRKKGNETWKKVTVDNLIGSSAVRAHEERT